MQVGRWVSAGRQRGLHKVQCLRIGCNFHPCNVKFEPSMSTRRFFATPELLLTVERYIACRRDLLSMMLVSRICYPTLLPMVWHTLYGVQNLLALLSPDSKLIKTMDGQTTIYRVWIPD